MAGGLIDEWPLYVAHPPRSRSLTVAVRRWPLATAMRRHDLRLDEVVWRPRRRLPEWLAPYLLVELPLPASVAPTVASPVRDGLVAVPSCLAAQGVLAAIHHAPDDENGWVRSGTGQPAFTYRKPGGAITTSVRPPLWGDGPARHAPSSPWAVVRALDDLDGDVLLIALAHALDRMEEDGTTWITADAILDDRGVRPRTERVGGLRYRAGHRHADRARVAASMERLGRLRVGLRDVAVMEQRDGRPRRARLERDGALLPLLDRLVRDGLPIAWRYRPGPPLAPFLAHPNRQTTLLAQAVLRYDPYRERWEKRLGHYLTAHLRMDARRADGAPLVRRIGPMLDELCLPMDRRHPERTRTRLEMALNRLARDGVIDGWAYTATARDALASLPTRHWVDQWRSLTLKVTPSRPVAARYPRA